MNAYSDEEDARDRVVRAADNLVRYWQGIAKAWLHPAEVELHKAVNALRSLHEDRGLRDPGTPGQ